MSNPPFIGLGFEGSVVGKFEVERHDGSEVQRQWGVVGSSDGPFNLMDGGKLEYCSGIFEHRPCTMSKELLTLDET